MPVLSLKVIFIRSTRPRNAQDNVTPAKASLGAHVDLLALGRYAEHMQTEFVISTQGQGLYEFTGEVSRWMRDQAVTNGLLTLFVRHTSASLLIQENADPEVQADLHAYFQRLVPPSTDPSMSYLRHTYEGPDDMPAHIKSAMMPVSLSIPVAEGQMLLGTWQGIYLFEHRDAHHQRHIAAHLSKG